VAWKYIADISEPQTLKTEKNTPLFALHRREGFKYVHWFHQPSNHSTIARPQRNNLKTPNIPATNTRANKPNKPSLQHKAITSITQKRVFYCLRKSPTEIMSRKNFTMYNYSISLYNNPKL
jgi:hypothetical protein